MPSTMNNVYDGVLDINHDNDVVLANLQAAGITAVIHKATEGATWQDPLYERRRYEANALGLLWGAYHFSSGRTPEEQVENFLNTIQWGVHPEMDNATLLALDFENSTSGANMTTDDACTFVELINQRTGRWPMVYGSNLVTQADQGALTNCALSNCSLWYASYNNQPQHLPSRVWTTWKLWQYTDGGDGPQPRYLKLDRSSWNGPDAGGLAGAWPNL